MLFTEPLFLFMFLPICLISQLVVKNTTAKNILLLILSLVFYAWGEPVYVFLMIATTLVCWAESRAMDKSPRRRLWLALTVATALLPLIFFKYGQMLLDIVNLIPGLDIPGHGLPLPIGISFYTFQVITYVVDLYRGETEAQKNPVNFMLYISLFPQLIAGPIVRYTEVEKQLGSRTINAPQFSEGVLRFVVGLGKKVLLANTVGKVVSDVLISPIDELSFVGAWGIMLCYTFQIYFDFSGYSDMAIGLGKMLGFTYNENFNYPYISGSIREFWRRWHISMNTFFRDYVYIPLGGNRRRQYLNMLIVWALTGLWHGAGLNFLLWGLYFFVLLSIGKLFVDKLTVPKALSVLVTFVLVIFGWVFFYFENMGDCLLMFKLMFGGGAFSDAFSGHLLRAAIPAIILCAIGSTPLPAKLAGRLRAALPEKAEVAVSCVFSVAMLLACIAVIIGGSYNPFLYFRF